DLRACYDQVVLAGAICAGVLIILGYFWWTRWGANGRFALITEQERAARRFAQQRTEWLASARTEADRELLLRAFWEKRYREALCEMATNNQPLDRVEAVRYADSQVDSIRRRWEREPEYEGPAF